MYPGASRSYGGGAPTSREVIVFDTVLGLPLHVLVIHSVVILGPVTGLTAVVYAVRPAWRRLLRLPLAALAVLTALAAVVAVESGQELEQRLVGLGMGGATLEAIVLHSERGELARNVAIGLAVVAVLAAFVLLRPDDTAVAPAEDAAAHDEVRHTPGRPVVALVVAVVLAATGVALVVTTVLAGHTGSSAVWSEIGAA